MKKEEFYGDKWPSLTEAERRLQELVKEYPSTASEDVQPVVYCCSRIKSPESAAKKLARLGLPEDGDTACRELYDVVGVRIICSFADEVYQVAKWLKQRTELTILQEKDYIAYPKPNGYRSYHLLVLLSGGCRAEIQLRTIAIDFWATLEHQLKYKRSIPNEELIRRELKRCADEIASVDLSMQAIRDILKEK